MAKSQEILLLIFCFSLGYGLPLTSSPSKTILITPASVKYFASFVHSSATISDTTIHFNSGFNNQELLRIPIAKAGELSSQSLVRITLGMNPPVGDNDPRVGITDGIRFNQFSLVDYVSSHTTVNPCQAVAYTAQNGRSGPAGNPVAGEYTLLFDPFHRFGSCTTNNGFNTDAKFTAQINPNLGLSLVINRHLYRQQYTFHYFLIEIL